MRIETAERGEILLFSSSFLPLFPLCSLFPRRPAHYLNSLDRLAPEVTQRSTNNLIFCYTMKIKSCRLRDSRSSLRQGAYSVTADFNLFTFFRVDLILLEAAGNCPRLLQVKHAP